MARNKYKTRSKRDLELFRVNPESQIELHYADEGVQAGFPSPAQDYMDIAIDLNKELIKDASSTFLARVRGHSMQGSCIDEGDILVVDKSLIAKNGDIVICFIDDAFTLKTLKKENDAVYLLPSNPEFTPIKITEDNNTIIWGVVTYAIRNYKNRKRRT